MALTFVATMVFVAFKHNHVFVALVCRDNQVFVALKRLSRQSGVCGFKTFVDQNDTCGSSSQ